MYISAPAIIQQINLLEASCNFKLFVRSDHGVRLTPAGRSLYEDAKTIVRLSQNAHQLSLVYSKEDVQAIMDTIQEHVNIFLEQNPTASEDDIKQSICETGDFVKAGLEDIDIPILIQKVEQTTKLKKRKNGLEQLASH